MDTQQQVATISAVSNSLGLTPFMLLLTLGGIILAVLFLFSKVRASDMKVLRDANKDYSDRIDQLEEQGRIRDVEIQQLRQEVAVLKSHNKTLEDVVIVALKQYFFENPKIAEKIGEVIK